MSAHSRQEESHEVWKPHLGSDRGPHQQDRRRRRRPRDPRRSDALRDHREVGSRTARAGDARPEESHEPQRVLHDALGAVGLRPGQGPVPLGHKRRGDPHGRDHHCALYAHRAGERQDHPRRAPGESRLRC